MNDQPDVPSKAAREFAEHQARQAREEFLNYIVSQRMDEHAKSNFCVMLADTKMPMRDPGMNRPFMTKSKKHADWICTQAQRQGYKCVVVTANELVQHLLNELGRKAGGN